MNRVLLVVAIAACGPGSKGGPTMNNHASSGMELAPAQSSVVSSDILAREPIANSAEVKHILIGWDHSGDDDRRDPRAAKRTKSQAEDLVRDLVKQLQGGGDFDAMMKQYSEDPGSASSARSYKVSTDASLVIEFKQLGLRLKQNEIGVVQSEYGFHVMKRVD